MDGLHPAELRPQSRLILVRKHRCKPPLKGPAATSQDRVREADLALDILAKARQVKTQRWHLQLIHCNVNAHYRLSWSSVEVEAPWPVNQFEIPITADCRVAGPGPPGTRVVGCLKALYAGAGENRPWLPPE